MGLTTQDEYGTRWLVKAGDPANPLINRLKAQGYELIILPRLTYITGDIYLPDWEPGGTIEVMRLNDCIGFLTHE